MFDTEAFKGWPNGDGKPVLELILSPNELEARYDLKFAREKDDLDWYLGSHFNDPVIGPIVLMRHENSPSKGTIVYVDVGVDTLDAVERIRGMLEISNGDEVWNALTE